MIVRRMLQLLAAALVLSAGAIAVFGTVGVSQTDAAPASADMLRIAITADIRGTDPGVTRDGNTDTVIHHLVESLVAYTADLKVAPMLAERVEASGDHRTYSFTLRDGVRFHNGAPLTSAEVAWSWRRMLDPATGFRCRSWYDGSDETTGGARIEAIETPDARTVRFRLDKPNAIFLHQMAHMQCVTAILHPDSVAADGSWRAPVGTGPYRLARWKRGEYVDLVRFDGYRPRTEPADGYAGGRHATTRHVRFVIVPEPAVGEAALRAGDLDIVPRVPLNLALHLKPGNGIAAQAADQLYWYAILVQTNDRLFSDPRMRRALAHAINGAEVAAIATHGLSQANPSAVPRTSPFHARAHDRWWGYAPARAKSLLREAGYRGEPVLIQTNRKFPHMFDNAVAVQAMLTAAGFDARLEVLDWATQLANYFSGDFQLSSFGFSGRTHPVLNYATIIGSKADNPAVQWDDERARQLLGRVARSPDAAEQQRLVDELHRLMAAEVPIIGLYNEHAVDLLRADVEGYANWPLGHPRAWGVGRKGS